MIYLVASLLAVVLSFALTPVVARLALSLGAIDQPGGRKIHSQPIARLGGLAMAISFLVVVLICVPINRELLGLVGGVVILVAVGVVDDIRGLGPWQKLFWQFLACLVALSGGIGIVTLTNPLGGQIDLSLGRFAVDLGILHFHITPIANAVSIFWMLLLINAINFLDGLDGLAAGVSSIAAIVMFFLAIAPHINQPVVAIISIILFGAIIGFLPYNFFPAKIFMGDSGSYLLGLVLAMLAIYSGAKLATAGLVLGVPIMDLLWAIIRRLYNRRSPFQADKGHLHHLMLSVGLTQRQVVLLFYLLAAGFGLLALYASSFYKLLSLVGLSIFTFAAILFLIRYSSRRAPKL